MKLLIDISDKMFDVFKKNGIMAFDNLDEYSRDMIAVAIAEGIPCEEQASGEYVGEWAKGFHEGFNAGTMLAETFSEDTHMKSEVENETDN